MSCRGLILALWVAWTAYWVICAAGVKRIRRRESGASRVAHLAPLTLGAWLIAAPHLRLGPLSRPLWPDPAMRCLGALVLVALGLAFSVWARVHLGRNWSATVTLKEEHELIRSGPYAYLRHPIYTGLIVALLGSALACGEPRALLGLALIVYAFVRKLRIEERLLREVFAEDYERYSAQVPALVPFTRARRSARR